MALKNLGRGVENFPRQPVGLKQTEGLLPPPPLYFWHRGTVLNWNSIWSIIMFWMHWSFYIQRIFQYPDIFKSISLACCATLLIWHNVTDHFKDCLTKLVLCKFKINIFNVWKEYRTTKIARFHNISNRRKLLIVKSTIGLYGI